MNERDKNEGYFRPVSGFPGNTFNFHHPVMDFRHFQLKQALDQAGMGAGYQNLRSLRCFLDFNNVCFDSISRMIDFTGHLLIVAQNRFRFTQVDKHGSPHHAGNHSCDDV